MSDTLRSLLARMLGNPSTDIPFIDHRQWPDAMLATPEGRALAALVEVAVARRRADLASHSIPADEHDPVWVSHIKDMWAASVVEDAAMDALLALAGSPA